MFVACMLAAILGQALAQTKDDIDWNRARQLHQRFLRGEKLTPEEQAYHDRAAEVLRARAKQNAPKPKPSVGLKPLTDMTANDQYRGQDGGLYGDGKNEPPKGHLQAALRQARLIQPLDTQGKPAKDGKVVFISVGISNTTQEFSAFVRLADADPAKSPQLVIVDGAQGGVTANVWANPGARNPWEVLDQRLQRASVTPQQVQVAWVKQAIGGPARLGEFPKHAEVLKGHGDLAARVFLHRLHGNDTKELIDDPGLGNPTRHTVKRTVQEIKSAAKDFAARSGDPAFIGMVQTAMAREAETVGKRGAARGRRAPARL